MFPSNTYLIGLIAITALISFKGFSDQSFFNKYQFHIGSIRAGDQYRMFTSGFLHADIMHFAFNMYSLYSFADVLINNFGPISFVLIYFGSMLFGSLLTLYFHKNEYNYRAIGASGAVTGVIYSAILLAPNNGLLIFGVIPVSSYVFGILYLAYSIYGMKKQNDGIGHTAHFGGAIGGFVLTIYLNPSILQEQTLMVVLLAVPIVILFGLIKLKKI